MVQRSFAERQLVVNVLKILFIHHRVPYPLRSGMDKARYGLLRSLGTKHDVTLVVPTNGNSASEEAVNHLRNICHSVVPVQLAQTPDTSVRRYCRLIRRWFNLLVLRKDFCITENRNRRMENKIVELTSTEKFDLVQASSEETIEFLQIPQLKSCIRILGPMDDVVEAARSNQVVEPSAIHQKIWALRIRARLHYQRRAGKLSQRCFFHSIEDLKRVQNTVKSLPKAHVLPVPIEECESCIKGLGRDQQIPGRIAFVGGLGSKFNVDAVHFFVKEIFPLIKTQFPHAQFAIIGQNPPASILKLQENDGFIVTGEVDDVTAELVRAEVYVSPLRAGTGFKTKVVEALNVGKAIVATPEGVQGLWDLGQDVIEIRSEPKGFADAVVNILKNTSLRRELESKSRKLFENSYSLNAVTPKVLDLYDEIQNSQAEDRTK